MTSRAEIKELFEEKARIENELHKAGTDLPHIIDPASYTDLGNAKRFVSLHQRNIKYVPAWKCWMTWDGKRWTGRDSSGMVPFVDEMIRQMHNESNSMISTDDGEKLRKHAKNTEAENRIMATIRLAAAQPELKADPDDFDQDKYLINFANGTINLKKKELREFRREDMMTKICQVEYNHDANAPRWLSFLNEIFENKQEMIYYIQTILGMCLTGDASQEQIFIFWGATGGNGKGTLVEAVAYILSEYHVPLPIESILSKNKSNIPNDIAMLKGARLCIINEPEFGVRISESKIKQLTSKDSISARFLGKEFFRFKPTHHTIIQTNPKPNIRLDGGIERRLVLVPFNYKVQKPDLNLDVKLRSEASGILNWLLDGCERWQREGLQKPQEVIDAIEDYKIEMDPFAEFFAVFTEKDSNGITPHNLIYSAYKLYCEAEDQYVISKKAFTQVMLEHAFKTKRLNTFRAFIGIRVTDVIINLVSKDSQSIDVKDEVKKAISDRLTQVTHSVESIPRVNPYIHVYDTVTPVTSVTNDSQHNDNRHNTIFLESVTSVTSVTEIINRIKELLDHKNKPDTIQDLERLEEQTLTEIQTDYAYDNYEGDVIRKMIQNYFHTRGWQ